MPSFPLGTEMTEVEQGLTYSLSRLRSAGALDLASSLFRGIGRTPSKQEAAALERLQLLSATTMRDRALRALILGAIRSP